jgi:galactan 5-O-arabinofuranosyltransferase
MGSPVATTPAPADLRPAEETPVTTRLRRFVDSPAVVAVAVWLIALPVAYAIPRLTDVDPFSERGVFVPVGIGALLLVIMTAVAWWRGAGEWVLASAAGLFAGWVALVFRVALYGSPFGDTGLLGDRVRVAAAATKSTVGFWPMDAIVADQPPEYPPLFPWLVGKAAQLVGVPAWRLLAPAEILLLSFAVLVTFLMWRRLVAAPVALVIAASGLLIYGDPRKAFAVVTLLILVPWLIATFTETARGRLHWLPAGVLGGLIMFTYNGWFTFGALGIVAIIVAAWRRSADRAGYLRHVLLVAAVSVVVAAPYLVPWGWALLTEPGQTVADLWVSSGVATNAFPFLKPTLLGALQLVGLVGLVWYRRRRGWAWPMLYLVLGSYAFWLIMGIRFVFTAHTTLFYYAPQLVSAVLLAAGVLTLAEAVPAVVRRFAVEPPYRTGAAITAAALLWVGFTYWQDWRPTTEEGVASTNNLYSAWAHLEALPDCGYPRFAPQNGRFVCLPANRIKSEVEQVLGPGARPRTLSNDERLFAYLPWPGYIGWDRTSANSLVRFDDRQAELRRLSGISDPAEFARASVRTAFGPIDVFVLTQQDSETWAWGFTEFHPTQFDPTVFMAVQSLPNNTVVVIRRP